MDAADVRGDGVVQLVAALQGGRLLALDKRDQQADVVAAVEVATRALGDSGRVLLRPSGTEQMVRVMVEASSEADARRIADELADVVKG